MKTLLEYIKLYPESFIATATRRSQTTPSQQNRTNHLFLAESISSKKWDYVESIITMPEYQSPLDGVVVCLNDFSNLPHDVCVGIYESWVEGYIL
tara:strand:- start:55169 stop:55453 length:285 start_codon:yes stop_codon:yes gene_type:complete